jgi:hypothetical protein
MVVSANPLGRVVGDVLYLDIPFDAYLDPGTERLGTLYRLFHSGGINNLIATANGSGTRTCTVDGDDKPPTDDAAQACPSFADIQGELTPGSAANKKLWPLTCQRPLVEVDAANSYVNDVITLNCYTYDKAQATFTADASACHMWYRFNDLQTRLVDAIAASITKLFQANSITGEPIVQMNDAEYDELNHFGRLALFDGFGQSEILDLASRFENAGLKTMIEHRSAYSVEQATMLSFGLGHKPLSYPVPMTGSHTSALSAADNDRYGAGGTHANELFYSGCYGWAAQNPYLTRATAGLMRLKVAQEFAAPIRGIMAWNLLSNYPAPEDPFYASGCSAGAAACRAVSKRDWLDFTDPSGFAIGSEIGSMGMFLPTATTVDPSVLDLTWDESVLFDMMLEGHHDLRLAQSSGVAANTSLTTGLPYGIVAGSVSACTLDQAALGVDPKSVCKDYQP